MKKSVFAVILGLIAASAVAKDIKIERFRYAGPYEMRAPLMLDSVSLDSQPFKVENLLETPLKLEGGRRLGFLAFGNALAPFAGLPSAKFGFCEGENQRERTEKLPSLHRWQ